MEVKNAYKSLVGNLKRRDHTDEACVGNSKQYFKDVGFKAVNWTQGSG